MLSLKGDNKTSRSEECGSIYNNICYQTEPGQFPPLLHLLQLQQSDMQVVLIFSSNAWLEDKVPKNVIALKVVLLYQLDWQPDLRSHLKDNTSVLLFSYAGITKGVRL